METGKSLVPCWVSSCRESSTVMGLHFMIGTSRNISVKQIILYQKKLSNGRLAKKLVETQKKQSLPP